jgi:hypothetical protein
MEAVTYDDMIKNQYRFDDAFPNGYPESQIQKVCSCDKVEWIAENRWGNSAIIARLTKENGKFVFWTVKDKK